MLFGLKYVFTIIILCLSDWTAPEHDVLIPWDLEGTPLHIKTDSTLGSDELVTVMLYDKESNWFSTVDVKFSSSMQYRIFTCMATYIDLPVQPPVEVEKTWKITKTETALTITCNDVEVLNYLFADSSNSNCVPKLGGDVVEQIQFSKWDTASDFYREGKGLN